MIIGKASNKQNVPFNVGVLDIVNQRTCDHHCSHSKKKFFIQKKLVSAEICAILGCSRDSSSAFIHAHALPHGGSNEADLCLPLLAVKVMKTLLFLVLLVCSDVISVSRRFFSVRARFFNQHQRLSIQIKSRFKR